MDTTLHRIGRCLTLVLLLLSFSYSQGNAQDKQSVAPDNPKFKNIQMDPTTGHTVLYWDRPDENNQYPQPSGYRIYRERTSPTGEKSFILIKEMDAGQNTYADNEVDGTKGPVRYYLTSFRIAPEQIKGYVWRQDATGNWIQEPKVYEEGEYIESRRTEIQQTLFVELEYRECKDTVVLSWNPYIGWGNADITYQVKQGETAAWPKLQSGGSVKDLQSIPVKAPKNRKMYYYILAHNETTGAESRSNLVDVATRKDMVVTGMEIGTITSTKDANKIEISVDKSSSPDCRFELIRQDNRDPFVGKLTQKTIWEFKLDQLAPRPNEHYKFATVLDSGGAEENVQAKARYYYLVAYDECNNAIHTSNMANSIILRVINHDRLNTLVWDTLDVQTDKGNLVEYRIYRYLTLEASEEEKLNQVEPKPKEYEIETLVGDDTHELVDDISPLEEGHNGLRYENSFCYFVRAFEKTKNKYSSEDEQDSSDPMLMQYYRIRESVSETKCITIDVVFNMPTAIDPLHNRPSENGLHLNTFAPDPSVVTDYVMYIYNKAGQLVYTGQAWDGKMPGGTYAPEGAYIYRIKTKIPGKPSTTKIGSFMVVYPTSKPSE